MAQVKATVKGQGSELFGRGIDLLFGDDEAVPNRAPASVVDDSSSEKLLESSGEIQEEAPASESATPAAGAHSNGTVSAPAFTEADVDQFLRMAAEAFLRVLAQKRQYMLTTQPSRSAAVRDVKPASAKSSQVDEMAGFELDLPPLPENSLVDHSAISESGIDSVENSAHVVADGASDADAALELDLDVPPLPEQQGMAAEPAVEQPAAPAPTPNENAVPPSVVTDPIAATEDHEMPDQPDQADSSDQPVVVVSENGQPRQVAPPGVTVSGPITTLSGDQAASGDGELSATLVDRELPKMSRKDSEEILQRLPKSDLRALDKQIDNLYEDVTKLFSGKRREITVAFEILRKARVILLKDPEQFAEAEYYVRQVQARVHQVRQSDEEGSRFWPRILVYQTGWLIVLSIFALITTVNGAAFVGWLAFLLGVPPTSETLGWAVLFISTLAWGGIGGATAAMWSLYYHISVRRDYEPIENLWYYTQPLIGMVLGGIVFLIMGSGFLVVQATPTAGDSAIGARLVPAMIAVIAGFRQAVVLDMIERIVGLITPTPTDASQEASTEELSI